MLVCMLKNTCMHMLMCAKKSVSQQSSEWVNREFEKVIKIMLVNLQDVIIILLNIAYR